MRQAIRQRKILEQIEKEQVDNNKKMYRANPNYNQPLKNNRGPNAVTTDFNGRIIRIKQFGLKDSTATP
jgi:hypothetical protein